MSESCHSWSIRKEGSESSCYLQPLWGKPFWGHSGKVHRYSQKTWVGRCVWCFITPKPLIVKSLATISWITPLIKDKWMTLDQSSISKHPEYWIYKMCLPFVTPLAMHLIRKASRCAQWTTEDSLLPDSDSFQVSRQSHTHNIRLFCHTCFLHKTNLQT